MDCGIYLAILNNVCRNECILVRLVLRMSCSVWGNMATQNVGSYHNDTKSSDVDVRDARTPKPFSCTFFFSHIFHCNFLKNCSCRQRIFWFNSSQGRGFISFRREWKGETSSRCLERNAIFQCLARPRNVMTLQCSTAGLSDVVKFIYVYNFTELVQKDLYALRKQVCL